MSFCLMADESVEDGIKRIVSEEIAQAIKEIDNPRLKRSEAIHEVRKHCKKIRGVLRLVRPQLEGIYQFENAWFRDTAKGLATERKLVSASRSYRRCAPIGRRSARALQTENSEASGTLE